MFVPIRSRCLSCNDPETFAVRRWWIAGISHATPAWGAAEACLGVNNRVPDTTEVGATYHLFSFRIASKPLNDPKVCKNVE